MTNDEIIARLKSIESDIGFLMRELIELPAPAPAPAKTEAKAPKIEDVRAALTALAGVKGGAAVKALLKDFSAEKLSDVAVDDYAQLLEAAKWKGQ